MDLLSIKSIQLSSPHRMRSGTVLSVGHPRVGRVQRSTLKLSFWLLLHLNSAGEMGVVKHAYVDSRTV